jgi:glyoxylase-like metal-dependent hydrolase (beta-lactamase superfamily II)
LTACPTNVAIRTLALDVRQLRGRPPNAINVYLVGDVLVGHIALWREGDRTLIAGDVFFNLRRLGPPPRSLTVDSDANRAAMRRLAELRPALVLFGHGPPLRDPDALTRAAAR